MDRETILRLIAEWRDQADYSYECGDIGACRAWAEAARQLEENLDAV